MVGIVAGCITSIGLESKLITTIVSISSEHAAIALVLTIRCCIVLGMGVSTTANYCIMAVTCAPFLISPEIGINAVAAHFFVFYFGIVADITAQLGIYSVSAALSGYIKCMIKWPVRHLCLAEGIYLMIPSIVTDAAGIILIAVAYFVQTMTVKSLK